MWETELHTAGEAARAAGAILLNMYGRVHQIMKKGVIDLVTEADLAAEKAILDTIRENFPKDNILSEEAGGHRAVSGRTWLVDPLDGTTNFAHGFPFFAVSIALETQEGLVLGVVFDPVADEYFEAVRGKGAFLNGGRIRVSDTQDLGESLLGTGFPYYVHERPEGVMGHFTKMLTRAQGLRRPGAAALDLCYVASGRFDGFWEEDLKPWDTAAGSLLVAEAGGRITTFEGGAHSPYEKSIVAANPFIHGAMLEVLGS